MTRGLARLLYLDGLTTWCGLCPAHGGIDHIAWRPVRNDLRAPSRAGPGAQRGRVVGMVMGESLLLVGIGIALGLGGAVWAGRFVKTVVFGLSPTDVATIGGAVALIAVVSTLAGYLPARRASRVDPMVALHQQ